jgi:hypothetical protein
MALLLFRQFVMPHLVTPHAVAAIPGGVLRLRLHLGLSVRMKPNSTMKGIVDDRICAGASLTL